MLVIILLCFSDTDLLELYIPILVTCMRIWDQNGQNKEFLEHRLLSLKRQGMKISENPSLLEEINKLEKKISNLV